MNENKSRRTRIVYTIYNYKVCVYISKRSVVCVGLYVLSDGELYMELLCALLSVLCVCECERVRVLYSGVCEVSSSSSLLNLPLLRRGVEKYINPLYCGWEKRYYKMLFARDVLLRDV